MALNATSIGEVRTTGSDTNGGFYDSAVVSTDYSQQNAAQVTIDNATITATCNGVTVTFTGGTYTVGSGDKGNVVNMISGASLTPGRYRITAVGTGLNGTWTLDTTTGMAGGAITSAKMGGALATPGFACGAGLVNGMIIYVKAGTYSITSTSTNVSNGCIAPSNIIFLQGYTSNRTLYNTDVAPVLQLNVSTATLFQGNNTSIINIVFDGNSQTAAKFTSGSALYYNCVIKNFNTAASGNGTFVACQVTGNSTNVCMGSAYYCEFYTNTGTPFSVVNVNSVVSHCIARGNTGGSTDGFAISAGLVLNCISYNNGRHGFTGTNSIPTTFINCHAESNSAGDGFLITSNGKVLINCSAFGNSTNFSLTNTAANIGQLSPASSVFVNAGGNNFALNSTTNAGALLRAAGYPSTSPVGSTSNFADVGVAQHQDTPATNIFLLDD